MQFIERETRGRVTLGAGTLYGAINTLREKGWLEPIAGDEGEGRRDYLITELGKRIAMEEQKRLADISGLAARILGGSNP